jgi:1-acyl-sn-glycerol-3-phosphate acyltransferase
MPRGTVLRRLRTIPTFVGAFLLLVVLAPLLIPLIALTDAVRWIVTRRHWMGIRLYLFGIAYLTAEVVGLVALGAVWLVAGFGRARRSLLNWTFAIQQAWASTLLVAARAVFGLRFEVEGRDAVAPGPILLFVRHASIVDNLLPSVFVSGPHGIRLRYVLKRELLSDPCLDVAGSRLPNYFVDRGSDDTDRELEGIRHLADGLGTQDGVLIYPEGTRFTKAKQERALEKLSAGDPTLYNRARKLRHVLPPRPGGPLALLDATNPADVVVLTHHGLDGFAHLRDIWEGAMVDTTIRVAIWRIPRADLPKVPSEQLSWLYDVWDRVDGWIDERARDHGAS